MQHERDPQTPLTLETVSQGAREVLLKNGEHPPTLIVQGNGQSIVAQMSDMADSHEGRLEQIAVTGFTLAKRGEIRVPEQVFFVSEAWMSRSKPDQAPINPPSKDPNRIEALIISALDLAAQENKLLVYEMIRDRKGVLREVKPHIHDPEMSVESPLLAAFMFGFAMGLLPPNG